MSEDNNKSTFKDFINRFRIHKASGKKEPFRPNPKIVFAILGIICAALIILSAIFEQVAAPFKTAASYLIVPSQSGINKVGSWLSDRIDEFKGLQNLAEENRQLQERIDELLAENNELRQQADKLDRYESILELRSEYSDYDTIAAEIISKDASKWFSTFTISKGTDHGILKNMNVVAHGGLVGVITDVGTNYAVVRTIINDTSNISATFENKTDLCVVSGSLVSMQDNLINFSEASVTVEINEGDAVVTSNVSSIYLPGLLIGHVADHQIDGNELTQSGHVTPVVDFDNLSEVLIITKLKEITDQ